MNQTNINFHNTLYTELRRFHGSIKMVASDVGKSREWVRWVLLGRYSDNDVILSASKVLKNFKEEERIKLAAIKHNLDVALNN